MLREANLTTKIVCQTAQMRIRYLSIFSSETHLRHVPLACPCVAFAFKSTGPIDERTVPLLRLNAFRLHVSLLCHYKQKTYSRSNRAGLGGAILRAVWATGGIDGHRTCVRPSFCSCGQRGPLRHKAGPSPRMSVADGPLARRWRRRRSCLSSAPHLRFTYPDGEVYTLDPHPLL